MYNEKVDATGSSYRRFCASTKPTSKQTWTARCLQYCTRELSQVCRWSNLMNLNVMFFPYKNNVNISIDFISRQSFAVLEWFVGVLQPSSQACCFGGRSWHQLGPPVASFAEIGPFDPCCICNTHIHLPVKATRP